jgi:hypothetical protein
MHMLWRYGPDHARALSLDAEAMSLFTEARLELHGDYLRNLRAWQRHYPDLLLLNYEELHASRADTLARVMAFIGLDPARMSDDNRRDQAAMLEARIWESTRFAMERAVVMYLHGLTWHFREECRRDLGLSFHESAPLLDGAA